MSREIVNEIFPMVADLQCKSKILLNFMQSSRHNWQYFSRKGKGWERDGNREDEEGEERKTKERGGLRYYTYDGWAQILLNMFTVANWSDRNR